MGNSGKEDGEESEDATNNNIHNSSQVDGGLSEQEAQSFGVLLPKHFFLILGLALGALILQLLVVFFCMRVQRKRHEDNLHHNEEVTVRHGNLEAALADSTDDGESLFESDNGSDFRRSDYRRSDYRYP